MVGTESLVNHHMRGLLTSPKVLKYVYLSFAIVSGYISFPLLPPNLKIHLINDP